MDFHALSPQACIQKLGSCPSGLNSAEASRRLHTHGANELSGKKPRGFLIMLLSQFKDFMLLILLAAAGISFATSIIEGQGDYVDPITILTIVCLNAFVSAVQERRAQKSLDALRAMSAPHANVFRDGQLRSVAASELVPGDVVSLRSGDLVPADCRVLEAAGLKAQESALTGESQAVEKSASLTLSRNCPLADRRNMLFASTAIAAGHGRALVTHTGMGSELGKIAHMLGNEETPQTPLQIRLDKVGKILSLIALGICAIIFVLHLLRNASIMNSFLLAVSLAVAAVPEGLPATVTVVLSLGVQRMARRGAILRSLPAVETLGAATVICSDKTGTLTQNEMRVVEMRGCDGLALTEKSSEAREILRLGSLCNNAEFKTRINKKLGARLFSSKKDLSDEISGDPTEVAILLAASSLMDISALRKDCPRIAETPFSSERKRMSSLHRERNGELLLAVKGAPDILLPRCNSLAGGLPMSDNRRKSLMAQTSALAGEGLRVLAVASKRVLSEKNERLNEENLTFHGLLALQDPPRKEAKKAVQICRMAGITPVMITGDHAATATAIARQVGIIDGKDSEEVITGQELEAISNEVLEKRLRKARVFARVTPEHKLRIVKALRRQGEVVAMTGDGVNDAPALKAADIGCAMGKSGTEVAKSAADMVLTDDNFSTIVAAVSEGRGIYENIKKAVHFLLSCNIGEIFLIFFATVFGMPAPLLPIQLLLVNLVTDSLPAMALGTEPKAGDIMKRRPISPEQSLFSGGLGKSIALEGCLIGFLSMAAFTLGYGFFGGTLEIGRSMCFATLSLSELIHALNMRSEGSAIRAGLFKNRLLNGAIAVCGLFQIGIISIPALAEIFVSTPLNLIQWLIVAGLSIAPLAVMELCKAIAKIKPKKRVGLKPE